MPPLRASDQQVGGHHYKGMVIQHAEFCQRNKIPWCEAAAIKYICRHKQKNGKQDLEKAIHYLQLCIEYEYPPNPMMVEPTVPNIVKALTK